VDIFGSLVRFVWREFSLCLNITVSPSVCDDGRFSLPGTGYPIFHTTNHTTPVAPVEYINKDDRNVSFIDQTVVPDLKPVVACRYVVQGQKFAVLVSIEVDTGIWYWYLSFLCEGLAPRRARS
jgi:hypothetical protein